MTPEPLHSTRTDVEHLLGQPTPRVFRVESVKIH